jgi:hypothetical protein
VLQRRRYDALADVLADVLGAGGWLWKRTCLIISSMWAQRLMLRRRERTRRACKRIRSCEALPTGDAYMLDVYIL